MKISAHWCRDNRQQQKIPYSKKYSLFASHDVITNSSPLYEEKKQLSDDITEDFSFFRGQMKAEMPNSSLL